ncbi:MAG TPA: nuclear transport factor 2 family protein [Blastocatellia bacterium]|nr:nuclear transport factor 2 family protein [Blastocatellia bacterium]
MKRILIIAALTIVAASYSACAQSQEKAASSPATNAATATASPGGNTVAEITRLEKEEWVQADIKKDIAWYENHWATEYISTSSRTGKVTSKTEDLADAKDPANTAESEVLEDLKAQDHGNVAVATGKVTVKGKDKTGPFTRQSRFTDVWVKRDGRWQVVATQGTLIPAATK